MAVLAPPVASFTKPFKLINMADPGGLSVPCLRILQARPAAELFFLICRMFGLSPTVRIE